MRIRALSHPYALRRLALFILMAAGAAASPATACTSFCFDTPDGPVFGGNMDLRWGDGLVFVLSLIHI